MANSAGFASKWGAFMDKVRPGYEAVRRVFQTIGNVIGTICTWLYRLRGVFLVGPVAYLAYKIYAFNKEHLPETVGLNLLSDGDFEMLVQRDVALLLPLCITAGCLLMMLCSRRPLFPWLVSLFTLAFPLLILMTNNFSGLLLFFGI